MKNLEKLTNIIESILFVSGTQVAICDIAEKLEVTDKEINSCVKILQEKYIQKMSDATQVLAYAAVDASNMLKTKALVVSTMSGISAKKVSIYRPFSPIVVMTPYKDVAVSLSLNWGVIPVVVKEFNSIDEIIENAKEEVRKIMDIEKEDKIIITGGFPVLNARSTNFMKIEEM